MSEFSKSALKQFRRLPKEEMLRILVELSNYAENQKAMSLILIARMKELEKHVPEDKLKEVNELMNPSKKTEAETSTTSQEKK